MFVIFVSSASKLIFTAAFYDFRFVSVLGYMSYYRIGFTLAKIPSPESSEYQKKIVSVKKLLEDVNWNFGME